MLHNWQLLVQKRLLWLIIPFKVSCNLFKCGSKLISAKDVARNELGSMKYLHTPTPLDYNVPISNYPMPRNIFYLSKDIILVVFFGYVGIL